jgi:hypothetical protein
MPIGSFAQTFVDWMGTQVTIQPWLGTFDDYGRPQYGPGVIYQCCKEDRVHMVRDIQGVERVSSTTLYLAGGPFDPHDRVTLPSSFKGPSSPPVINVLNIDDRGGVFDHSEIHL